MSDTVIYRTVSETMAAHIAEIWGAWVRDYDCLHLSGDCFALAALSNNEPVGFISVYPAHLPAPLNDMTDAFIDIIEVREGFRRQGIARELLIAAENWAQTQGYYQIRAWSSDDKTEAIRMWRALGYGICPAVMRGISAKGDGAVVNGFYAAKKL